MCLALKRFFFSMEVNRVKSLAINFLIRNGHNLFGGQKHLKTVSLHLAVFLIELC